MTQNANATPESWLDQAAAAWSDRFAERLLAWHARHGRHALPWHRRDPYRIWVSEVMLQQTQVATVLPYYERFISAWPTVAALAKAPLDAVLAAWSGLGYYARARHLHAAAQWVAAHWRDWPRDPREWEKLPGVGRSTAAAICAFAFGVRAPILDGNVQRVLVRLFGITQPLDAALTRRLWQLAEALLPARSEAMAAYTQAQMDLGALVCTRGTPSCPACPFQAECRAHALGIAAALPLKRPRAPLPRAAWRLRAYEQEGHLWWVRRPEGGIWGGLWSLPLASDPPPPGAWTYVTETELPPHRLTHRVLTLIIETWRIGQDGAAPAQAAAAQVRSAATSPTDGPSPAATGRWASVEDALAWGLPQPLRRWAEGLLHPKAA